METEETCCARCSRTLRVGDDCFQVARGVLGTRGFILLEAELLCSEDCFDAALGSSLGNDFDGGLPRSRRVP